MTILKSQITSRHISNQGHWYQYWPSKNDMSNVSFTCYFAPSIGNSGKCFVDFVDYRKNLTIEASNPADTSATHSIGVPIGMEYRISVHDVFPNGTVQKEAVVIHTSFSIPFPSMTVQTKRTSVITSIEEGWSKVINILICFIVIKDLTLD